MGGSDVKISQATVAAAEMSEKDKAAAEEAKWDLSETIYCTFMKHANTGALVYMALAVGSTLAFISAIMVKTCHFPMGVANP